MVVWFLLPTWLTAQVTYSGVWIAGKDRKLWADANWISFKSKWEELNNQGYRLIDIETAVVNGERHYSGVWEEGSDAYKLWVGMDWQTLKSRWDQLKSQNLRLVDLEVYTENGQRQFIGVWRQGTYRQKILVDATLESLKATDKKLRKQDYRLTDVEAYLQNGQHKYAGVWNEGNYLTLMLTGLNVATFQQIAEGLRENDFRLIDVEIVPEDGEETYIGLWREGSVRQEVLSHLPWQQFLREWKQLRDNQMVLEDLEVSVNGAGSVFTTNTPVAPPLDETPPARTQNPPSSPPTTSSGTEPEVDDEPQPVDVQYGKASYYADKFHGKPTASGELYDRNKLTAAHRTLPFGTRCRVTNLANGKSVIVRINDRGPHVDTRVIDLSYKAAKQIGLVQAGLADVKVEVLPDNGN